MTAPSEDQWATAVIAALNAAYTSGLTAYDFDDVPATAPASYTQVSVTRRFGGEIGGGGSVGTTGYRIFLRYNAKYVSDARNLRAKARTSLEDVAVIAAGVSSTPCVFESAEAIGLDGTYYSGSDSWTFTS